VHCISTTKAQSSPEAGTGIHEYPKSQLSIVPHESGRTGNVYTPSKATDHQYGESSLFPTTNSSLVSLVGATLTAASADKTIRHWRGDKQIGVFERHSDVVRSLCEIPGLGFASCGNDAYPNTMTGVLMKV